MTIPLWAAPMVYILAILEIPLLICLGICTKELHVKYPKPSRKWEMSMQLKEVNKIIHMLEEEALSSGQYLMVYQVAFQPASLSLHLFKSLREEMCLNSHTNIQMIWFKVVCSCSHLESNNKRGTIFLLKTRSSSSKIHLFVRLYSFHSRWLIW